MYGYGYKINSGLVVGSGGGGGGFTNTYSLDFDGVDDYVDTGITNTGTNNLTISCWIKTTETFSYLVSRCAFGGRNNVSGTSYTLGRLGSHFSTPDDMKVRLFNTLGTTKLNDGNWHNIIYTYDYTTKEVKAYVDGNTTPEATATFPSWSANYRISIGWNGFDSSYYFEGNIDECSLWYSILGASDITEIYNSGAPNDLTDLSPIAWYRMGDNGAYKSPQWLIPNNENKDKVSNYSFEFDGVNDYVDCGNPTDLQITGAFTLSAWTKLDSSVGSQACLMSKDSGASGGQRAFSFWGKITNKPVFYIWNGASNVNVSGTTNIADNTWHHVAVVYVPSTSIRIYVDGVLEGTNATSIPASINNAVYDFKLGVFSNSLFPYKGLMDDVSVFNSDQSANMSALYNSGTPTTLPSGAVAHYKMGEEATFSTNWTVPDQVGSNDGTSNGMTIEDRVGDAPNSTSNSVSYNMDEVDRVEDTP